MSNQSGQSRQATPQNMATVRYGAMKGPGPYAGMTVAQLREKLSDAWGIPPNAPAVKGKNQLSEDHVIQPTDVIDFTKPMGEKG